MIRKFVAMVVLSAGIFMPVACSQSTGGCCGSGGGSGGVKSESPPNSGATVVYTCPMHPEVQQGSPGKCPKCGMELVPKK